MKTSVIVACLLATGLVHAQTQPPEPFSYKGMALGAAKDEFASKMTDWECRGSMCSYLHMACWDKAYRIDRDSTEGCVSRNTFGGVRVSSGNATFRDGKLSQLYLSVSSLHAKEAMQTVAGRFGKPDEVDETPFKTQGGGTFPNMRMSWRQSEARMSIWMNSGKLGSGSILLQSEDELRRQMEERKERTTKGSRDF